MILKIDFFCRHIDTDNKGGFYSATWNVPESWKELDDKEDPWYCINAKNFYSDRRTAVNHYLAEGLKINDIQRIQVITCKIKKEP